MSKSLLPKILAATLLVAMLLLGAGAFFRNSVLNALGAATLILFAVAMTTLLIAAVIALHNDRKNRDR